jgi:hypothetical protein
MMYKEKVAAPSVSHTEHKGNVITVYNSCMLHLVVINVTARLYNISKLQNFFYQYLNGTLPFC